MNFIDFLFWCSEAEERGLKMDLKTYITSRWQPGMTIITDVDGVHTSRQGGVSIGSSPQESCGLIRLQDGVESIDLVPADPKLKSIEITLAGFVGADTWEFYRFHTPDGQAVQELLKWRLSVVVVSGREAAPVKTRFANKLYAEVDGKKVRPEVHLGVKDKIMWAKAQGFDLSRCVFIGDGAQDAPLLAAVHGAGGIAVAPPDAEPEAIEAAGACTEQKSGEGCFAELASVYLSRMFQ